LWNIKAWGKIYRFSYC